MSDNYHPPSPDHLQFDLVSGYTAPSAVAVNFAFDDAAGRVSRALYQSIMMPLRNARGSAGRTGAAWGSSSSLSVTSSGVWVFARIAEVAVRSMAYMPRRADDAMSACWSAASGSQRHAKSLWNYVAPGDRSRSAYWACATGRDADPIVIHQHPVSTNDVQDTLEWHAAVLPPLIYTPPPQGSFYVAPDADQVIFSLSSPYAAPLTNGVDFMIGNGSIEFPPYVVLRANAIGTLEWNHAHLRDTPEIMCWGRGPQYHRPDPLPTDSGWTGSPNEPPPIPIARKVYIIMNDVQVVRLPERTPIDVLSVDLSASVDAWCWSVRMELANPAQVALLAPDGNGPKLVEVAMNGYTWTAIIESRDSSRAHADQGATVIGRSQTALLSDTYTARRSKAVGDAYSAQQLATQEITDRALPFTVDWRGIDWIVPGGAWYYQDLAPIDVIAQIAAGRGAVLQSAPGDPQLIVQSRYPVSPWAWSAGNADVALPIDWVTNVDARQQSKPMYDAVIIAGQQQGVLARITRQGSAGATFASQVVDQLILTPEVATERGRNVLADRGVQEQVDMDVPLFPSGTITAGMSGLYAPLLLVDVQDPDDPWQGQSVGVTISARRGGPDNKALEIWQRVSLERHLSDAH